ncbi:MAG: AI-2E family transporter [Thermodesulfobacteriota bacterium]|nr:AI-2E family transporter [Thermodesulfobacteriota bacterium]
MVQIIKNWYRQYLSDPQIIILFALILFGFLLIITMGQMLAPVFAAIIIAYLLEGLIYGLVRLKISRKIAMAVVFLLFIAALLLLIVVFLPMLSKQIAQMVQELPGLIANGQKELMRLPEKYPDIISQTQVVQFINFLKSEVTKMGQHLLSFSIASVRSVITIIVYLILVPLLVFFFLKDKKKILKWMKAFMPSNTRLAAEVWVQVNQQISNYVRGKIWEIAIVWVVSYGTFTLLGLKFSLLISLAVGFSVLAPYIGATVMTIPVALMAFFQWGPSSEFAWVVVAYGILQALDGNLLAPLLLSEVVNLHPVAIIVALLVFGGFWGMWGLFFAIPLATLVHAVLNTWFRYMREKNDLAQNHPQSGEASAA